MRNDALWALVALLILSRFAVAQEELPAVPLAVPGVKQGLAQQGFSSYFVLRFVFDPEAMGFPPDARFLAGRETGPLTEPVSFAAK